MASFFDEGPINVQPEAAAQEFKPIPEGQYVLTCTKCEEKQSKNGDPMLSMTWEVDESTPEYGKRKVFSIIMLNHAKAEVAASGKRQLHAAMLMCGMTVISDASDFIGRTCTAKVKVTIRKDTGEARNEMVFAKPKETPVAGEQKKLTPTQPSVASDAVPW